MAYVINPDGTITTVPADYDRNGNLSIKKGYTFDEESGTQKQVSKSATPQGKSSNRTISGKLTGAKTPVKDTSSQKKVSKTIVLGESSSSSSKMVTLQLPVRNKKKTPLFISEAQINKFFINKIANHKELNHKDFQRIINTLSGKLAKHFNFCYREFLKVQQLYEKTTKKSVNKLKKTIGAKQSANNMFKPIPKTTSQQSGRKPKYGYARDRFGRVQERDSFNEEKRNEFYQANNSQKHYDYSSFDANDDNDGAYSNWE